MTHAFRYCLLILLVMLSACGGGSSSSGSSASSSTPQPSRSFKMGFTPWVYEATFTAQDFIYDRIQNDGDIISQHIMDGVPWQEALDGDPYPQHTEDEISARISHTLAGIPVYLSIDSLNGVRTELVGNWGASGQEARSGAWATLSFDDQDVIDAYINFALDLIGRFQPDYFNYGVEVGGLVEYDLTHGSNRFAEFVVFAAQVYNAIKTVHPDLDMMVSLSLKTPGNAEMQALQSAFPALAPYVDRVGISVYPYAFFNHADKADPANLPADWLSQIQVIAPGKPIAIAETSWAAEDLVIASYSINLSINAINQRDFADVLLQASEDLDAAFVIWWAYADFDILWASFPASAQDIGLIWRDTGLLDENLNERPALQIWRDWFARRYAP